MSSELTIDIQLTELGFSSWDFQLLKQKESPQTNGSSSEHEATSSVSPTHSVESHVGEETNIAVGQNTHVLPPSNQDSQRNADHIPKGPTAKPGPCMGQKRTRNESSEDDGDRENNKDIRNKDGNWEMDIDVNDEEEDEEADYNLSDDDDDDNNGLSSDTNVEEHRCHVCDLNFSTPFLLKEHLHVHTGVRPYCCAECGKQFCHLANYQAHLRSHTTFSCLICTARFATQELLQGHLDTNHFEEEFYQCDFCKRIFVNLKECEEHVQTHKQEVGKFPCPQCDRSFQQQSSLLCHLKWHKKSSLICTDCGQAFSKKIALLRHSFVHLGLLPYTCMHCKRHFRLASLYNKHNCKPEHIQCVACLVIFNSQDDFDKHKIDTGCWGDQMTSSAKISNIRCMECGEVFDSSEELKKHAGTHQRVMKCSECGMGFRSSLMLMSHMGGHAGQRPCLCKVCGLGFPHQHSYDSHLKTCGTLTLPQASLKKPKLKPHTSSKTKVLSNAPNSKILQAVTSVCQKEVSQGVALHSFAPVGNQTKTSGGPWTLVLNKESHPGGNVPVVMLMQTPISPASEVIKNAQSPISSSRQSEKHLSAPQILDIPLTTPGQVPFASTGQVANLEKHFLLHGMANPAANILVPLTGTANGPKMRWTVLEDECASVTDVQVNAEHEQKGELLSCQEKNDMSKTKPLNLSTADSPVSETPLCLVKVKTKPNDQYRYRTGSQLEENSDFLATKIDSEALDATMEKYTVMSVKTPDLQDGIEQNCHVFRGELL
ncbi:zinc finger and BTB domain-containing protein 17 isoform X2 [Hoplias malabaricus]|uniref:zinc finger and BTB domain-containing protein 17 isoform X2 n=1 Tax=Hoplias malabaricus TaxID=27720 RepID=UPI003462CE1D